MSAEKNLVSLERKDGIAHLRLQDESGRNELVPDMVIALTEALAEVAEDTSVKVMTLLGGEEYFSTGANRELLESLASGHVEPSELTLALKVLQTPVPVIGAARGSAIGGGLALLFAADMVMIARESRYGANFMALGITPGMGSTRLFESTLSPALAHELLYAADLRRGSSFEGCSGFNAVLPADEVEERARELAWTIAEHPRENLVRLKTNLVHVRRRALLDALTREAVMHRDSLAHLDTSSMT